jgi:hypothetical protein
MTLSRALRSDLTGTKCDRPLDLAAVDVRFGDGSDCVLSLYQHYFRSPALLGVSRGLAKRSRTRQSENIQSSSMVEHAAVNRVVVGSSPTFGATSSWFKSELFCRFRFSGTGSGLRNVKSVKKWKKFRVRRGGQFASEFLVQVLHVLRRNKYILYTKPVCIRRGAGERNQPHPPECPRPVVRRETPQPALALSPRNC